MSKEFGKWVISQREERDWNQGDLAREMSRSQSDVGRVESGEREPSKAWCIDFSDAMGLELDTVRAMAGHAVTATPKTEGKPIKSNAQRKIEALLSILNAEDQEEAIELLDTFAKNRRKRAAGAGSAKKAAA